jgi:hypothetical protein
MDYGFEHDGTIYTPNGTPGVPATTNTDRNMAIEQAELAAWALRPERQLAYYDDRKGIVTTWPGTIIGTIVSSNVYRHNMGGRFISLRVKGTNGAEYAGRASYDWGTCVGLKRCKG